jgi:hypothetical protein
MGSRFIETLSYEPDGLAAETDPQSIRSIKANPNYRRPTGRGIDIGYRTKSRCPTLSPGPRWAWP